MERLHKTMTAAAAATPTQDEEAAAEEGAGWEEQTGPTKHGEPPKLRKEHHAGKEAPAAEARPSTPPLGAPSARPRERKAGLFALEMD